MRAVLGSRSGPMTIRATTAMTTISEKPTSNMGCDRFALAAHRRPYGLTDPGNGPRGVGNETARSHFLRRLLAHFSFDRLAGNLRRRFGRRRFSVGLAALHAFLEPLDRAPEIGAHVAQFFRTENEYDDQKNDQPMPNAQSTHVFSSMAPRDHRTKWVGSGEHVDMHMHHFLPADATRIDDRSKAVVRSLFAREPTRERHDLAERRCVALTDIVERRHVPLRDQHEMHGRFRIDI